MDGNKKKRPISTRNGRSNKKSVSRNNYQKDLDRLEKINAQLLKYKGTELYMETCQHAYEILKRVNQMNYE